MKILRDFCSTVLAGLLVSGLAFAHLGGGAREALAGSAYSDAAARAATGWSSDGSTTTTTQIVQGPLDWVLRFGSPGTAAIIHLAATGWEIDAANGAAVLTIAGAGEPVRGVGGFQAGNSVKFTATPRGTATLNFPSTAITTCDDLTITVANSTVNDEVMLGIPNAAMVTGSQFVGWVSAAGTVSVRHCCLEGATCDPGSGTFSARTFVP